MHLEWSELEACQIKRSSAAHRLKMSSHAACEAVEQHFERCSADLDATLQTIKASFDSSAYRRVPLRAAPRPAARCSGRRTAEKGADQLLVGRTRRRC